MTPRGKQAALILCLAAALVYVACGGASEDRTATPNPSAPQTSGTLPSISPLGSPGTTANPGSVLDLASASALTVGYAVGQGDLRSDQPGLATGDVNGDGIGDIIAGGRFADGPDGRQDSGAAYVILGSKSPQASVDFAQGQQDVTIIGAQSGDNLGFAATSADLNGDGVDDIVVAAPFASPPDRSSLKTGIVYVIFGRPDLPPEIDLGRDSADVTITGTGASSFFGDSLTNGDVNGDGRRDLIIGATFDSSPSSEGTPARGGAVYVFLARKQWPAALTAADNDAALYGAEEFDELGDFVSSGDVNGDGIDDIVATAEAADGPDNSRGTGAEVHVLLGRKGLQGNFLIARGQSDLAVYGGHPQDTLGFSTATGDLNGDGFDDIAMGARLGNGPNNSLNRVGQVYIFYGRKDLPRSIDLADPPDDMPIIYGQSAGEFLGTSEAIADLDGDGRNELIMGAGFGELPGRADSGAVYIARAPAEGGFEIVGSGDLLRTVVYGAAPGDNLGTNVAVTDFNGDGRLDLIAVAEGAAGPDTARPGAGRVYAISVTPP